MADGHFLGGGDLHMVDEIAVPHRLEDAVGEAEHQDVLHGFLAQVVVDAEDLVFGEDLVDGGVEVAGGFQAGAEGLFDDDAAGAAVLGGQPGGPQRGNRRLVELRGGGQVIDARGLGAPFQLVQPPAQRGEVLAPCRCRPAGNGSTRPRLPDGGVQGLAEEIGGRAAKLFPPGVVALGRAGETDDPRGLRQPPLRNGS